MFSSSSHSLREIHSLIHSFTHSHVPSLCVSLLLSSRLVSRHQLLRLREPSEEAVRASRRAPPWPAPFPAPCPVLLASPCPPIRALLWPVPRALLQVSLLRVPPLRVPSLRVPPLRVSLLLPQAALRLPPPASLLAPALEDLSASSVRPSPAPSLEQVRSRVPTAPTTSSRTLRPSSRSWTWA